MVAIIDYDAGNIKSVEKALHFLKEETIITRNSKEILSANKVILPGVGSFGNAMKRIKDYGLQNVIKEIALKETPFLGICLGLQLLFKGSEEEGGAEGLGILAGKIVRIPAKKDLKIPHIGWNSITFPRDGRLFAGIRNESYVYFVHSYYLEAEDKEIVTAMTDYGISLDVSVEKNNVFACQFHPEKSSETGLRILSNFIHITEENN